MEVIRKHSAKPPLRQRPNASNNMTFVFLVTPGSALPLLPDLPAHRQSVSGGAISLSAARRRSAITRIT